MKKFKHRVVVPNFEIRTYPSMDFLKYQTDIAVREAVFKVISDGINEFRVSVNVINTTDPEQEKFEGSEYLWERQESLIEVTILFWSKE